MNGTGLQRGEANGRLPDLANRHILIRIDSELAQNKPENEVSPRRHTVDAQSSAAQLRGLGDFLRGYEKRQAGNFSQAADQHQIAPGQIAGKRRGTSHDGRRHIPRHHGSSQYRRALNHQQLKIEPIACKDPGVLGNPDNRVTRGNRPIGHSQLDGHFACRNQRWKKAKDVIQRQAFDGVC